MSPRVRPARWLRVALLVAATLLLPAATASAASPPRYEEFDLPSTQGNVDLSVAKLNRLTKLMATVRLPAGYDDDPGRRWPVLYLLPGIGDHSESWAFAGTGNLESYVGKLPAIVVMPEGGRGFFVDWWRNGERTRVNWMSYLLGEVLPTMESRYRIADGRANHAIGGVSMGGYGAIEAASQLPGYFGSVISLSALVDQQSPDVAALLPQSIGASYDDVWGPMYGPYANSLNPTKNTQNLVGSRMYLSVGNGVPDARFPFRPEAWTVGVAIEGLALAQNTRYDGLLSLAGIPHVVKYRNGVHDWPYWRREMPAALAWNPFAAPPVTTSTLTSFNYRSMQPTGNAWGLGYRFTSGLPAAPLSLRRRGQIVSASGTGTVTFTPGAAAWDSSGAGSRTDCAFTAKLPFATELPEGC